MDNTLLSVGKNQPVCRTSDSCPTPFQSEHEPSLKRFLNLHSFAGDVAEEGPLARRPKLFRSERERLDGEGQLEILGNVEDLLDEIYRSRSRKSSDGNSPAAQNVDAQRVTI